MKKSCHKLAALLLTAAMVVVLAGLLPSSVSANPGLEVGGALLMADVSPGQILAWPISVSISKTDPATNIVVQVMGMTESPDGVHEELAVSDDTGPFSARSFISIDNSSFHLDPGASETVNADIQVPQNVGDGGRYAMINISEQSANGSGVQTVAAVDVQVALTIKGSQLIHTGKITGLSASVVTGQPINILTDFQNTGNHHFDVQGEVTIKNAKGQTIGTIAIPLTTSSILPGTARQLKSTLTTKSRLAPGTYTIDSKIMLEDGTLLDETTNTFGLTTQYVPPTSSGINWVMIGIIAAAVIIFGVIAVYILRSRRRKA